jgi:hypothetical protein
MSAALDTYVSPALESAPRIVSAGAEDVLERFNDPALLSAGKVNLISLEAVETRFGSRWAMRQDQVYDFTARVLERGVGVQGFFHRVSATDFFVVHPDLGRVAGQAACLRYLREVLNHFLGEDSMAANGVLQVTRLDRGALEARRLDLAAESEAAEPEPEPRSVAARGAGGPQDEASLDRWTPFVAADGRQLRVTATLEPMFELKGFTRIGFRMIRRVITIPGQEELSPKQVAMLSTADLLRVDLATIARGIGRLRAEQAGEQHLSLIVPLSYVSLASQAGRAEFVKQLKAAGALVKLGVICEICDIEGVPPGALLAATSLVRPFSLLVVGRLAEVTRAAINQLQGSGLNALAFDAPQGLGDAEFVGWSAAAIGAAKRVAKSVLICRVESHNRAATLASLGATHMSLASGR